MIADGGVKYSGEVTKALAAGASSVMMARFWRNRRGAGRARALSGWSYKVVPRHGLARRDEARNRDRYAQTGTTDEKLVPMARGPAACRTADRSVRSWSSWSAAFAPAWATPHRTIPSSERTRTSSAYLAGCAKATCHDVIITEEAPNYRV